MPGRPSKPGVNLTAFGKHPAWGDHIDDLPLPGPELAPFKQAFYGQIQAALTRWVRSGDNQDRILDSGDADADAGLLPLDHHAVWIRDKVFILARIGPSSDRAGRAKFPLVVAAQVQGTAPAAAAGVVVDALDTLFDRCMEAQTQEEVRADLARASAAIAGALDAAVSHPPDPTEWRCALAAGLTDAPLEVARALRHLRLQAEGTRAARAPASHLRVPTLNLAPTAAAIVWARLLVDRMAEPLLALAPRSEPWLDLFGPAGDTFDLVRIRSTREPLATVIAYDLGPDSLKEARRLLGLADTAPAKRSTSSSEIPRRGPRKELVLGAMLTVAGLSLLGVIVWIAVRGT
jgi:hypothetical protein